MDRGFAQTVGDAELDAAVAAHTEDAVRLLERLVAEASVLGEEAGAQEVLAGALAGLGLAVDWLTIPASIAQDPAAGVPPPRTAGNGRVVVGRLAGAGDDGRSLVVNGHLDVVPPGAAAQWSHGPYSPVRRDGWLLGRGSSDMKGGWAMTVLALSALRDGGWAPAADLTVVAAVEEECSGNGTLASVRAGVVADAAYLPEPTDLRVLLAGIGVLWLEVVVEGRAAHAAVASDGASALDGALAVVEALRRVEDRLNQGLDGGARYHVNVGTLQAGDWPSSVPAAARLEVRVGFPAQWSAAQAEDWVRDALAEALDGDARLDGQALHVRPSGFRAEGYSLPADAELAVALAGAHAQVHDAPPATSTTDGTTDARFYLNQAGMPALCYGPRSRNMHGVDEAVELASIVDGARTLTRFLPAWLGSAGRST